LNGGFLIQTNQPCACLQERSCLSIGLQDGACSLQESDRTIAKRLGVGPRTIQRWLAEGHGPYAGPRKPRRSPLDWSTRYLRQRWEAGECNDTVLWQEIEGQGLLRLESQCRVTRLAKWREHLQKYGLPASLESVPRSPLEDVTPGKVIGWMLARPGELRPQA
jgi:hypothetical protein